MVMTGFAPSKLFETAVEPDRIKERLAAMREASKLDPDGKNHDEAFGMWERHDRSAAQDARIKCVVEAVQKDEDLDLGPILEAGNDDVRTAILDYWSSYVGGRLPAPPDGVIDGILDSAAKKAATRVNKEVGQNLERLFNYPQFFLSWICELIKELVRQLTCHGHALTEVYIQVPNVDIPLEDDATAVLVWGYTYSSARRHSFTFDISWYGRHVVKEDWMAYARVLALAIYRTVPEEFDDDDGDE